ncbi:MAG: zinc ribbon domain-containing protein, partial [Clostridia bacterium]|nr:zinc ribbon domain-containing protein [Clostridia bacterium]
MFCSNCGKTIDATQEMCPHCGEKIGQSKMGGHTSVQSRYEPVAGQSRSNVKYAPYTKTTYTSNVSVGDDVYSRTAYRPVIVDDADKDERPDFVSPESGDDVARPDASEAQSAADDAASNEAPSAAERPQLNEINRESLERLESVPEDAPDSEQARAILARELDIKLKPVTPIRKTGISPEVEEYIKRVEAMKNRSRKKRSDDEYPQSAEESQELPEDAVSGEIGADGVIETVTDEEADSPVKKARKAFKMPARSSKSRSGKSRIWLGRALVAALIVVLIGGGVVYLSFMIQPQDQIEGVDNELFEAGVELIKSHTTTDYRTSIITAFRDDTTGATALALQARASEDIRALTPSSLKENDEKFINTLLTIQESIDAATTTDALAALTRGDASLSTLSDESAQQWAIINNYVTRLENANELSELDIVSTGVADVLATPEP